MVSATDLFGWASNVGGGGGASALIASLIKILMYGAPAVIIIVILTIKIRERQVYKYPVRVFRRRENGKIKETNYKGGYVKTKAGIYLFRVKVGMMPWAYRQLDLPQTRYMDEEDRLYYNQIDVDVWIQCRRHFMERKVKVKTVGKDGAEGYKIVDVIYQPVSTDIKAKVVSELQKAREVLGLESTWAKLLPHISLVVLGIVFLIAYYMLINK